MRTSRGLVMAFGCAMSLTAAPMVRGEGTADDRGNITVVEPSYRSWTVEDENGGEVSIHQIYLPFSESVRLGDRADLIAFGAFARTTVDFGDEDASLSGLTDAKLKGVWRPSSNAFLSVGVNLPIGKQTLDQGVAEEVARPGSLRPLHEGTGNREVEVAQAMWSPILGFRARRMGEGLDVEFSAGAATQLSSTVSVGAGAGYTVKGSYDLFRTEDGTVDFHPGSEASASVGFDFRPSEGALFRLDVAGRTFQDDESQDVKVYRAGTQIEVEALISKVGSKTAVQLRARNVSKSDDERFDMTGDELVSTAVRSSNSTWGTGEVYVRAGSSFAVGLEGQVAVVGDSDAALSDGSTTAIGPGVRWTGERHRLGVKALYLGGNAEDKSLDLKGVDVSVLLSVSF